MKNRIPTNQLRYSRGYIIYYYYSDKVIRIPLMKVDNETDIDKKSCLFKVKRLEHLNKIVLEQHEKINTIIKDCIDIGDEVDRNTIMDRIKIKKREETPIIDLFDKFIETKEKELLSKDTIKDYKSCKNVLSNYQDSIRKELYLSSITSEFLLDFRIYLLEKRSYNDSSIRKRFKTLSTFFKSLSIDYLKIKPKLSPAKTDYIVFNKSDLELLKNFKKFEPKEKVWIDLFLLNSFMGLRFGDLATLEKGSFFEEKGEMFYEKTNEKTNVKVKIYLVKTAREILEKYDYKLPFKLSNQIFNREIKKVFRNHDLFSEVVKKTVMIGGEPKVKEYMRRDLISSHSCRRGFITMNIKASVDLSSIQMMSGHTSIQSLGRYVKKSLEIDKIKKIDI